MPLLSRHLLSLAFASWAGLLVGPALAAVDTRDAPYVVAQMSDEDGNGQADATNDAAALTVRVDRLESTIRSLTGQIEQLQFQNRKLTEDLRKMQEDVEFRFQDLNRSGGTSTAPKPVAPQRRGDVDPAPGLQGLPQDASGVDPAVPATTPNPVRTARRTSDAFDPDSNPTAPGAPRPLGTTPPSPALASRTAPPVTLNTAPSAPLDLMKRPATASAADGSTENGVAPIPAPSPVPGTEPARPAPNSTAVASLAPGGTRDEFNGDLDLFKQGQYDSAASGLRGFLDKYPRDRLVPDAVYLLGETYTRLGRHREAAEQYLRLSTDFSKAPRAPDALLRLGMSLNAMGVREQACATYQEVTRRFPTASTDVRAAVDRELKKARC